MSIKMTSYETKLPSEILGKVFIHTLPDISTFANVARNEALREHFLIPLRASEYLSPFTICSVSRHWNHVATACPQLWSFIVIDIDDGGTGYSALKMWIRRSGCSPLTFICASSRQRTKSSLSVLRYLRKMFRQMERWQNVIIALSLGTIIDDLDEAHYPKTLTFTLKPSPLLQKAYVHFSGREPRRLAPLFTPLKAFLLSAVFSPESKELQEIDVGTGRLSGTVSPRAEQIHDPARWNLSTVCIRRVSPIIAVELLLSCPVIESFDVVIEENDWSPRDPGAAMITLPTDPVFLPHLRNLRMICEDSLVLETIFTYSIAPSLDKLELGITYQCFNTRLRNAFSTFLSRSECHITRFKFEHGDTSEDNSSPIPFGDSYWCSMKWASTCGLPARGFRELISRAPNVEDMVLSLPLAGYTPHRLHIDLPHLQSIEVREYCATEAAYDAPNYSVLLDIHAPHLRKIGVWWPHNEYWPAGDFRRLISRTNKLTFMSLVLGFDKFVPQFSYFHAILSAPGVNASLESLIFWCPKAPLDNNTIKHLTLSPNNTTVLPKLRNLIIINSVDSDDGQLASMVASRFLYGSLESFHVHFDMCIGQPRRETNHPSYIKRVERQQLHLEDECMLVKMRQAGKNVTIDRGKSEERLYEIVGEFEQELKK